MRELRPTGAGKEAPIARSAPMKVFRLWLLGWLALSALSSLAHAQPFVPLQAGGQGEFVSLSPLVGADGLPFANPSLVAQTNVGGRANTNLGNVQIGFDYIRPFWSSRDFMLSVPAASAGAFPLLGDVGHVDNHFGLAPVVRYKYDIDDIGLAFSGSGSFLNLTGFLERQISDTTGGQGILTASSALTLITVNLPEISLRYYHDELFPNHQHFHWSLFEDLVIDLGVGTRYSSIQQNYTGSLTNTAAAGVNQTTRYSTQSFQGFGFTAFVNFSQPVMRDWIVFSNFRGSIIGGENNKESTLTVTIAGVPGQSSVLSQNRTEFIPVMELELGTQCGLELGERLRAGLPPPLFTLRLAATGQFWGNVGPLSAGSPQGYDTSNLFLVGAHIMVGFHR